ncbi:UNVERIFIED_CONTAM: hypothetical protein RMT77_019457 [Armadillidium vulgare]
MIYCHYGLIRIDDVPPINAVLKSIRRLKLLQEINFCDTYIKNETIWFIALYCPQLRELNLHQTNFSNIDAGSLIDASSVIKKSLTKLIIHKSFVPTQSVEWCLLNLKNLTHFQSDRTIEATLKLFERIKDLKDALDEFPKFKTTICKNQIRWNWKRKLD